MKKPILLVLSLVVAYACEAQWNQPSPTNNQNIDLENLSPEFDEEFMVNSAMDYPASFPDGQEGLRQYFTSKFLDRVELRNKGEEIIAEFCVQPNGRLTNAVILSSEDKYIGSQLINFIYKMPNWNAAHTKGMAVKSRVQLKVSFGENTTKSNISFDSVY